MTNIANLTFKEFIVNFIIGNIIQPVIVLIFALAIMYFLWNITQFIKKSNDTKEIEKFKTNAIWGIIAIFVMASMWGLVQFLINSFVPGAGIPVFDSSGYITNPRQYSKPIGPAFTPAANFNPLNSSSNYTPYNTSGTNVYPSSSNAQPAPAPSKGLPWDSNSKPLIRNTPEGANLADPMIYGNTAIPQQVPKATSL